MLNRVDKGLKCQTDSMNLTFWYDVDGNLSQCIYKGEDSLISIFFCQQTMYCLYDSALH